MWTRVATPLDSGWRDLGVGVAWVGQPNVYRAAARFHRIAAHATSPTGPASLTVYGDQLTAWADHLDSMADAIGGTLLGLLVDPPDAEARCSRLVERLRATAWTAAGWVPILASTSGVSPTR